MENNKTTNLLAEISHAQKNVLLQGSQALFSKNFVTNDVKEQLKLLVVKNENFYLAQQKLIQKS